jgi:hypothetical protein
MTGLDLAVAEELSRAVEPYLTIIVLIATAIWRAGRTTLNGGQK